MANACSMHVFGYKLLQKTFILLKSYLIIMKENLDIFVCSLHSKTIRVN